MLIQHQPRSLLQPTARSIADHGVADLLGDGKAKSRRTMILSRQCLHHHAGRRCLASFGRGTQELGTTCQAARAGQVQAAGAIRPTGACGPWSADWPALCGLRRWPCGRGTHAAACGPASTVDRCASQPVLRWCLDTRLSAGSGAQPGAHRRRRLIVVWPKAVNRTSITVPSGNPSRLSRDSERKATTWFSHGDPAPILAHRTPARGHRGRLGCWGNPADQLGIPRA